MIKTRFLLPVLAAAAAIAIAGCGSGDSSSSSAGAANFAAPRSLVYVEGDLQPSGSMSADVDSLAQSIAGVDDLGALIASKLESSAEKDGEPVDFAKEVEPWLGEKAGVAFGKLEDGDLSEPVAAIETTDAEATQAFVDKQAKASDSPPEDASYKGIDFKVDDSEESAIGVVDDFLLITEDEASFKAAIDASDGDSLADEAGFERIFSAASEASLADVYIDVGKLLDQSDDEVDPQAREALDSAGIDPSGATAVASIVPGSDQIEIDVSSDLGGQQAPSGDVSEALGSVPADSFAAFATTRFGDQLKKAIDNVDAKGIEGSVPPNQLKRTLKAMGIDLDKIADSFEDAAVFAQGANEDSLVGAMVLTASSNEAAKAVTNFGVLLRSSQVSGVTAVSSNGVSGFSIRDAEQLGDKPLVVVAKGDRVAIGYSLAPALEGLSSSGERLSDTANYKAAVAALGGTPISAFIDGPAALRLAEAMVSPTESDFQEAKPYLRKATYVGIGTGTDDDLATAKLIVGVEK